MFNLKIRFIFFISLVVLIVYVMPATRVKESEVKKNVYHCVTSPFLCYSSQYICTMY